MFFFCFSFLLPASSPWPAWCCVDTRYHDANYVMCALLWATTPCLPWQPTASCVFRLPRAINADALINHPINRTKNKNLKSNPATAFRVLTQYRPFILVAFIYFTATYKWGLAVSCSILDFNHSLWLLLLPFMG